MKCYISPRASVAIIGLVVCVMAALMIGSMRGDSLTFDEAPHLAAGYTYLTQSDFRLNPEHPPLVKDLAALPLLFLKPTFPLDSANWRLDDEPAGHRWWLQFNLGQEFIFDSENDPDQLLFWARIPMVAVTVALGLFLSFWAWQLGGRYMAIGVSIIYAFSPTFLAHGRLVVFDVAAALGVLVALYFWLRFLARPTSFFYAIAAAMGLALALLTKFSTVPLLPCLVVLTVLYPILQSDEDRWRQVRYYVGYGLLVGLLAVVLIVGPFYQVHMLHYSSEQQVRDTIADLSWRGGLTWYESIFAVWGADRALVRPFAQLARGILMGIERAQFGNVVYFLGQTTTFAFRSYYPVIYAAKLPLAWHALSLIGLVGFVLSIFHGVRPGRKAVRKYLRQHFSVFALFLVAVIFWLAALVGTVNLGIRYIIITLPLIYLIVFWGISQAVMVLKGRPAWHLRLRIGATVLLLVYPVAALLATPHHLAFYNVLAGGVGSGYKVAVDSNYDWGQDLKRLAAYVEDQGITEIYLDYAGFDDPQYRLSDAYRPFDPHTAEPPTGWFAVSASSLLPGLAEPVAHNGQLPRSGYYEWLADKTPVARAGVSIFIYKL